MTTTTTNKKDRELAFWANELASKRVTQDQYNMIVASLHTVSASNSETWDQNAFGFKPKQKGKCSYKGFEYFDLPRDKRNEKSENGVLVFECFYDKLYLIHYTVSELLLFLFPFLFLKIIIPMMKV